MLSPKGGLPLKKKKAETHKKHEIFTKVVLAFTFAIFLLKNGSIDKESSPQNCEVEDYNLRIKRLGRFLPTFNLSQI